MGQEHGKSCFEKGQSYFHQQLALYRWRSNPASNPNIPQVHFTSKERLNNRKKLQQFLHQQLTNNNYVDISNIKELQDESWWHKGEEVMTFENYITDLDSIEQTLSLEQTLYVLRVMLSGYECLFNKFKKVYIDAQCCFLTEKGDLRVWINPNPTINEFLENVNCQQSQGNAINAIIRLCENLTSDSTAFSTFRQQLISFMDKDVLHNVNFSSIRRFVNGYVYAHQLLIPQDLWKVVKKMGQRPRSCHSSHQSYQRHSEHSVEQPDWSTHLRLESTKANLAHQISGEEECVSNSVSSQSSNQESRHFQFYRPNQPYEKKVSSFDLNCPKAHKRSLNRSDVVSKKSDNNSVSSSFSKKSRPQIYTAMTPNTTNKSRARLESTIGQSCLAHSKVGSGLTVSKIMHCNSTMNLFENKQNTVTFDKKPSVAVFEADKESMTRTRNQTEDNPHSRQPSFDQKSSSLFISPASEQVGFEYRVPQVSLKPNLSKIQAVSQSQQSSSKRSSNMDLNYSMRRTVSPSMLTNHKVSGLVQNLDIHMFESRGQFLSFENNSNTSDYRGALISLGRSAKMVSIPTSKRIERHSRRQN